MARNEWKCGLHWLVTMRGMQIGVANTTGFRLHQDLARFGRGNVQFPKHQWLSELLDNRGMHLTARGTAPLVKQWFF
jgi:hypothetical protein